MQSCHQFNLSPADFSLLLTLEREGENEIERKHAAYQNDGKSCYLEN